MDKIVMDVIFKELEIIIFFQITFNFQKVYDLLSVYT